MVMKRKQAPGTHVPSDSLDISLTNFQRERILKPSRTDMAARDILKDAGGDGATQSITKRVLDAAGGVKAFCASTNDPSRVRELEQAAALALSLSEISRQGDQEKAAKAVTKAAEDDRKEAARAAKAQARAAEVAALKASAPAVLGKLKAHQGELAVALGSLLKAEMRALLFAHAG